MCNIVYLLCVLSMHMNGRILLYWPITAAAFSFCLTDLLFWNYRAWTFRPHCSRFCIVGYPCCHLANSIKYLTEIHIYASECVCVCTIYMQNCVHCNYMCGICIELAVIYCEYKQWLSVTATSDWRYRQSKQCVDVVRAWLRCLHCSQLRWHQQETADAYNWCLCLSCAKCVLACRW